MQVLQNSLPLHDFASKTAKTSLKKMNNVTIAVSDKKFKLLYGASEINAQVERMAKDIKRDMTGRKPLFICMLNGAFMFAADVLRAIGKPCEIRFVRLSSYSGTKSMGKVNNILGLDVDLKGRDVVILEDIVETGCTMHSFIEDIKKDAPASVSVASLVVKPERLKEKVEIKYVGFKMKANDFIVGYGMDYNQEGRNLSDIYIVEE